ncbi:MAG: hypothetical protein R3217_03125 [Gammaproteobacteria bacterium]|nr:hypothetical protein [Gammaproteobacteria bacterium]
MTTELTNMKVSRLSCLLAVALLGACGGSIDDATPPTGSISYTCDEFVCTFTADGDNGDVDGNLGFRWDFPGGVVESGRKVRHVFSTGGEQVVQLTTVDRRQNTSTVETTVTLENVPEMAAYVALLRSGFATLQFMSTSLAQLQPQLAALDTATEAQLGGASLPATLQCDVAGTATLTAWEDPEDDQLLGPDDERRYEFDGCSFDSTLNPLDAPTGLGIGGDTRSDDFALGNSFDNEGVDTGVASNFRLVTQGSYSMSASQEDFLLEGDFVQALRFNAVDNPVSEYSLESPDLRIRFDNTEFFGKARLTSSTLNSDWTLRLDPAVTFAETNGEMRMTSGQIDFVVAGGSTIRVTAAADPAYLQITVYQLNETTPALSGTIEQRFVLEAFDEF